MAFHWIPFLNLFRFLKNGDALSIDCKLSWPEVQLTYNETSVFQESVMNFIWNDLIKIYQQAPWHRTMNPESKNPVFFGQSN